MWIQSVVLENHGDVAVLRRNVVHEFSVDIQFSAADLLKTRDHAERRGLAAAGRSDKHDEFLVGNIKIELLNGNNAFIRYLQIYLFLFRFVRILLFSALFLLAADKRVDFLDVLQLNLCHIVSSSMIGNRPPLRTACPPC